MIREIVFHTDPGDIPQNYCYDTETPDFYVYRNKYTGQEIHKSKNPPIYINIGDAVQRAVEAVLKDLKSDVMKLRNLRVEGFDLEQHCDNFDARIVFRDDIIELIDKYREDPVNAS